MDKNIGLVSMEFQELYMIFTKYGHKYTLKGLMFISFKIIISHHMDKLLKKGHPNIISQFNAI
jgi:hypothetical protein